MERVRRRAARVLVVDPALSILLFQFEDDGRRWWATPGGGLEDGESFLQGALREAHEELRLTHCLLTPLWSQSVEFPFRGQLIQQVENYFLLRAARQTIVIDDSLREVHRREGIVGARWWTIPELESTPEQVFPVGLVQRLRDLPPD